MASNRRCAPGDESATLHHARAPHGSVSEGRARQDFFQNTLFRDMTARVFVQVAGNHLSRSANSRSAVRSFRTPRRACSSLPRPSRHPGTRERGRARSGGPSGGNTLERRLGPLDAAAIIVSNVIGGGIFFVPVIVAGLVSSAWTLLSVWLVGGVLAFAGAMATRNSRPFGPPRRRRHVYLRDAYGPGAAFFSGWTSFVAGFSGGIATGAVALAS